MQPSSYHVKMAIKVETQKGLRTGESVLEVRAGKTLALLPEEAKAQVELRGEAAAVHLPDGQTVFAVLRPASDGEVLEDLITSALDPGFKHGAEGYLESVPKLGRPEMIGRSVALAQGSYPLLVRFKNISDPKSVEAVQPADFPAVFGSGTKLVGVDVILTSQDVTTGISETLTWLPGLNGSYLSGRSIGTGEALGLHGGDFSRE
jgi:hypothetical protein